MEFQLKQEQTKLHGIDLECLEKSSGKSRVLRVALSAAIVFALAGCAGDNNSPIRIGATMSETGAYATQGVAAKNGYLLCAEHVNAAGGVLGRNIEFIIHNDESNTERAHELYSQLIVDENVDAIMGPYGSTLTEAVAPITEKHRMVHISPLAATSSIWEQGRHHLFMVLPPAELFLAGLIDLADKQGFTRVAVLQEDSLFPRAAGRGAVALAEQRGMQVLLNHTYTSGTGDFSDFLQQLGDENIEILAMAASALDDFVKVRQQLNTMGIEVQMFGNSGAVSQYQEALGAAAEGDLGLSAWEASLPNPGVTEFVADYVERFQMQPSFHAAGGYGSCQLLVEAARRAGSLHTDALRQELLEMDYTTVFSRFKVDNRGYQVANQGVFVQWQNGEKVVVWPQVLATAELKLATETDSE
ncbi:ABC-type branched-chain amino acid transport system, periplasmic component [Idiomarina sp. A28L]|uniref:amino acid ABC transporter substrate-binding protein n=1 Tax=Idiomarina sp. A28L TaxID=1036674 RepID=UPI00021389BB|nr:amino acid ABC transporter substrate-binding protein [Idiomarina sp. A28L]EGN74993.1 ABC-type branched-chain amino acid transport system, periplasmic component [Idiomarina sp. A28L]